MIIVIIVNCLPGKTPGGPKITKRNYEVRLVVNLLWPVVINKTDNNIGFVNIIIIM